MFLEFPEDRTTHYLDRQYMLGPSLLVAPIFVPDGEDSEYYIPEGAWTSFFHPELVITGPKWVKEVVPIDEIPVFVRPGTVLCLGPDKVGRPDYELNKTLEVRLYELSEGVAYVPRMNGTVAGSLEVKTVGDKQEITVKGDVDIATVSILAGGRVVTKKVGDEGAVFVVKRA